jgi:hypothetical protein
MGRTTQGYLPVRPSTKQCSMCKETLPSSSFNPNYAARDLLQSACRECIAHRNKAYRIGQGWEYTEGGSSVSVFRARNSRGECRSKDLLRIMRVKCVIDYTISSCQGV